MQTHFWKYYCPWYITVSMYNIVILWNIISRFFCQMTIIFFVRNSAILWWRSQLYVWPSRASSRVYLNYSRLHLTCAKFMQNFASQYLIPQQCTSPNINWVLLFKTGKIFPRLVLGRIVQTFVTFHVSPSIVPSLLWNAFSWRSYLIVEVKLVLPTTLAKRDLIWWVASPQYPHFTEFQLISN